MAAECSVTTARAQWLAALHYGVVFICSISRFSILCISSFRLNK